MAELKPLSARIGRLGLPAAWLCLVLGGGFPAQAADELVVGVQGQAPPMSFRDARGDYAGYSVDMARAACKEMGRNCRFVPLTIAGAVDDLRQGRIDIAAISLLPTPERRAQILLARPYVTSISVWVARPGLLPEQTGVRVAVVQGSAQARFAAQQQWQRVEVSTHSELPGLLQQGRADGLLAPMMTVIGLMKDPGLQALNLSVQPRREPELSGPASFGVTPLKPELKTQLDAALERLERNGVYDRINSQYLSIRVN